MELDVTMNATINNEGLTVQVEAVKNNHVIDSAVRKYVTGVLLGKDAEQRGDQFSYQIEPKRTVGLMTPNGVVVSHRLQMVKALEWPDAMLDEFKRMAAQVHEVTADD